jgi:hypothetical protein
MARKLKDQTWFQLPRQTRLAAAMYPNLVGDDRIKAEMHSIIRAEGRSSPYGGASRGTMKPKDPWKLRSK